MKSYSSREVIAILKNDGWYRVDNGSGDHQQYKHDSKRGRVTIPHPRKDLSINVLKSIERQAGIKFK